MLLETFSATGDNILLYSENRFDTLENFYIVFKQTLSKKPEPLSLVEVIQYINMPVDKNLIVYRLLTNIRGFNSHAAKYGLIIKIDNMIELVYLDPVYAVREMEEMAENLDSAALRFRIQQVGLHSSAGREVVYSEVYSFDLMADEARNQNDRVFAEAVYAFDVSFNEDNITKTPDVNDSRPAGSELNPYTEKNEAKNAGEEVVFKNSDGISPVIGSISDHCNASVLIPEAEDLKSDNSSNANGIPGIDEMAAAAIEKPDQHANPGVSKIIVETTERVEKSEEYGLFFSSHSLSRDISDGIEEANEEIYSDPYLQKRRINTGLPAEYIARDTFSESKPIQQGENEYPGPEEGTSGQVTFRDFLARRQFQEDSRREKKPSAGDDGILNVFRSSAGIGSYLNSRKQHPVILKLEESDHA